MLWGETCLSYVTILYRPKHNNQLLYARRKNYLRDDEAIASEAFHTAHHRYKDCCYKHHSYKEQEQVLMESGAGADAVRTVETAGSESVARAFHT